MKYTVIESFTAWGNWTPCGHGKTWEEAWTLHQELKAKNPQMTYHVIPG